MSRGRFPFTAALVVVVAWAGICSSAHAAIFTDWTSASGTTASGTLNGTSVTATFSNEDFFIESANFSDTNVFNPPGSSTQSVLEYEVRSAITWTFSSPISDLLLYAGSWRGSGSQGPTSDTYIFDASPTITSGFADSSTSGNSLLVGNENFNSGILRFAGPLTSLTLSAPAGAGFSNQLFTLAVVPEPSTCVMALAGIACGGYSMWRRRKRA